MPHVKIEVGDLTCVRQADRYGKDDVYWIGNIRCATAVDAVHTNLAKLFFDSDYDTSLPELVSIGTGETRRFAKSVFYEANCPAGSFVFGTIHFLERDTPLANYFAKIIGILGIIIAGLVIGAVFGVAIGFAVAGLQGAIGGGIIVPAGIALVGFCVAAFFELIGAEESDAHLGGMRFVVGPIVEPAGDHADVWALTMAPAGKLHVVDAHDAELIAYPSSHASGPKGAGHKYETALKLEISGGHL